MLDMAKNGAMAVYLKYCGAHTLRWAGGDKMNWQNFKRGSAVREAVMTPPGYVICVVDAAQIECRLLVWHSGQTDMVDKFRRKEDVYSEIASEFYGEHVDKNTPDKRGTGKQIVLSCGFGAGADSIQNTARIGTYGPPVILTDEQALAARNLYRRRNPRVVEQWNYARDTVLPALLRGDGDFAWGCMRVVGKRIYMPDGAWIDYTNLHHNGEEYYQVRRAKISKTYGGKIVQNITEGLSRTFLKEKMMAIAERYKVCVCSHDEIVYLAPEAEAQEALDFGLNIMKAPPVWASGLPLDAEGGFARNYSK
jgi:DNA polymerase